MPRTTVPLDSKLIPAHLRKNIWPHNNAAESRSVFRELCAEMRLRDKRMRLRTYIEEVRLQPVQLRQVSTGQLGLVEAEQDWRWDVAARAVVEKARDADADASAGTTDEQAAADADSERREQGHLVLRSVRVERKEYGRGEWQDVSDYDEVGSARYTGTRCPLYPPAAQQRNWICSRPSSWRKAGGATHARKIVTGQIRMTSRKSLYGVGVV